MIMWHGNWSGADWVLMSVGMLVFWAAVIGGILWLVRTTGARSHNHPDGGSLNKRAEPDGATARDVLDSRYAGGELSDDDYRARRDTLTIG
jgi:putative membrane protein